MLANVKQTDAMSAAVVTAVAIANKNKVAIDAAEMCFGQESDHPKHWEASIATQEK